MHCTYQRKTLLFTLIKVSTFICKREILGCSSPLSYGKSSVNSKGVRFVLSQPQKQFDAISVSQVKTNRRATRAGQKSDKEKIKTMHVARMEQSAQYLRRLGGRTMYIIVKMYFLLYSEFHTLIQYFIFVCYMTPLYDTPRYMAFTTLIF